MSAVQSAWRAFCARSDHFIYGDITESKSALLADMGAWVLCTNNMKAVKSDVIIVECLGYSMPEENV